MLSEKNVALIKEIDNVLYKVLPQTSFDQVYDNEDYTLTEIIADINKRLGDLAPSETVTAIQEELDALMREVPDEFNTLKKIADYINLENPESPISVAFDNTVRKDDISDDLLEKLKGIYSKTEIDTMMKTLEDTIMGKISKLVVVSNDSTAPADLPNDSLWFQIVDRSTMG